MRALRSRPYFSASSTNCSRSRSRSVTSIGLFLKVQFAGRTLHPPYNNLYNFAVGWALARRDSPQTG